MRDERGVALMLVLWVIVVLGFLSLGIVTATRGEIRAAETLRARSVARYAAESGVVAAAERLRAALHAAAETEAQIRVFQNLEAHVPELREQALGDARFQVAIADLNARVDLNESDERTLLRFFGQFVDESGAASLVDALEDWKDADDEPRPRGGEIGQYLAAGSPFYPTNRPLMRLEELERIFGFADSVTAQIAPYVTVHGDGRINVNAAPRPVLASVPWLDEDGADAFLSARESGEVYASLLGVTQSLREQGRSTGGARLTQLTSVTKRILVVSRGWQEGHPLTHEIQAVFEVDGLQLDDGPFLKVKSWIERGL